MTYIPNLTTFVVLAATLGLLTLSVPLLLSNANNRKINSPLVIFLSASTLSNALPLFIEIYPPLNLYGLAILLPCYMLLPANLWWYIVGLTAPTPWHPKVNQLWHLLPFTIAIVLSVCLCNLPQDVLRNIFSDQTQNLATWPQFVVITAFLLMIVWVLLSAVYMTAIGVQLMRFRSQLKNLFANNETRELHWVSAAICALCVTWGLSLCYSIPLLTNQNLPLPVGLIAIAHFAMLWTFSIFGIKQLPAFAGRYLTSADELGHIFLKEKYQKSGLNNQSLQRIAAKLDNVMLNQKPFLDHTLSLQKLAKQIQVSTNNLSQTLNEYLNKNFFDYINHWRIQYAIPQVLEGDKSILDIAMDAGFNARSSFYKAFKNATGHSPGEYRKQHLAASLEKI